MQLTTTFGLLSPDHDQLVPILEWPAVPHGDANGFRFFAPRVQAALVGEQLTVGYGAAWPLVTVNMQGDTTGILTRPWQPRPVTEADRATIREAVTRPNLAPGFLDDDRFDQTFPAFGTLLPGAHGTTWVQGYAPPYFGPDSVTVFGLPRGFRPTDVTRDLILGHGTSPDGDFEVRVYRVTTLTSGAPGT
jgi:hypothetical protein